jgi:hypothetical protein
MHFSQQHSPAPVLGESERGCREDSGEAQDRQDQELPLAVPGQQHNEIELGGSWIDIAVAVHGANLEPESARSQTAIGSEIGSGEGRPCPAVQTPGIGQAISLGMFPFVDTGEDQPDVASRRRFLEVVGFRQQGTGWIRIGIRMEKTEAI